MAEILQFMHELFGFIGRYIILIDIIFAIIIVFFERRDPKVVWAWLLLMYFIPILGFILYLIIGMNIYKNRMFKLKEVEENLNAAVKVQEDAIKNKKYKENQSDIKRHPDLAVYNLESSGAVMTFDNDVKIFTDGREKFDSLINDIRNAKHFIHFQYYIIRDDELMAEIAKELIKKAEEGVKVRILYDAMGCRNTKRKFFKNLNSHENISVGEFFPAWFRHLHVRINYRNHRKIVVIDNEIAYVGGFNVGREYLGKDKRFGYWRDTHLRIRGTAAVMLNLRFILDFNYATKEDVMNDEAVLYYPEDDSFTGNVDIQIISSGPDSTLQNIRNNYLKLINGAKRSIYIQTPYFIPDEALHSALLIALHSGVEVNIMIPCKPDHPLVYWATYSYFGDLLKAGANCYTYDNGFLHAKGVVVDDELLCYGTANMDIRSFALNFEVNALIYDKDIAKEMVRLFKEDVKLSTKVELSDYLKRNAWFRFKEQFCRLFSPLL